MLMSALRRFLGVIPVLVGVAVLVFVLVSTMPGDPVLNMMGERVSEEAVAVHRERLGLNDPWLAQLGKYLGRLVRGDLGQSIRWYEPVSTLLAERLPYTMALAGGAMILAVVMGIGIGVLAGSRPGSIWDMGAMLFGLLGISTPVFWFGMLLLFFFGLQLGWLPGGGVGNGGAGALMVHMVLPVMTLGIRSGALLSRYVRAQWIEARQAAFVLSAKARGYGGPRLYWGHVARPNLGPVLQVVGLDFASYLTGSVVTENIFAWPGLGSLMFDAIKDRDIPVLSGAIVLSALVYALVLYAVDIFQAWADPRARVGVG